MNIKDKILRYMQQFVVLSAVASVFGCTQPIEESGVVVGGEPVSMEMSLKSATENESHIKSLRTVMFGGTSSHDREKLIYNNEIKQDFHTNPSFKALVSSGYRDIYFLANFFRTDIVGGDISNPSYGDIEKMSVQYSPNINSTNESGVGCYLPSEIPMVKVFKNYKLWPSATGGTDGVSNIGEVKLDRLMCKLDLKIKVDKGVFPAGEHVVIDSVQVGNLPKETYIIPKKIDIKDGERMKSETQKTFSRPGEDLYSNTFYLPEHLQEKNYTVNLKRFDPIKQDKQIGYVTIWGHVANAPSRICIYYLPIGDAMSPEQSGSKYWDLTRNTHYTVSANIKSYGQTNLGVSVSIDYWTFVDYDLDVNDYVKFVKISDEKGADVTEGTILDEKAHTLRVSCNTNVGGWYTVTRDQDNNIVHRSPKTSAVITSTTQQVEIPVRPLGDYNRKYKISIYHPLIAPESSREIHLVNIRQDKSGIIPREVLMGYAWPLDKLLGRGVQIIKCGNRLPTDAGGSREMLIKKCIDEAYMNFDATSLRSELGYGESNTDILMGIASTNSYCMSIGKDCYLPSFSEVIMIALLGERIGTEYQLNYSFS